MTSDTPRTDAAILTEPYQIKELPFEVVKASKMAELERELNARRWIPITERLPTIEDGNGLEDVEWSDGAGIWEGNYAKAWHRKKATHWRRITLP